MLVIYKHHINLFKPRILDDNTQLCACTLVQLCQYNVFFSSKQYQLTLKWAEKKNGVTLIPENMMQLTLKLKMATVNTEHLIRSKNAITAQTSIRQDRLRRTMAQHPTLNVMTMMKPPMPINEYISITNTSTNSWWLDRIPTNHCLPKNVHKPTAKTPAPDSWTANVNHTYRTLSSQNKHYANVTATFYCDLVWPRSAGWPAWFNSECL